MKITKHVKVASDTYGTLAKLPCVASVARSPSGRITVLLSPEYTSGTLLAHTGDYLVRYASGQWQRFGSEAFFRLVTNPRE